MFRIPHLTVSLLCLSSAIIVTNCHRFLFPLPRKSLAGGSGNTLSEYFHVVVWILNSALARQAETRNVKRQSGGKQNSNDIG